MTDGDGDSRCGSSGGGPLEHDAVDAPDAPDAPATEAELAQARALAEALEPGAAALRSGCAGEPRVPDGVAAELVATAAMIRAAVSEQPLAAARRDALVDEALGRALDRGGGSSEALAAADASGSSRDAGETLADARAALRRSVIQRSGPLLALAASVLLVVGAVLAGLPLLERHAGHPPDVVAAVVFPAQVFSRPSNDLLGRPITDRTGASGRLDMVFADRLAGYRLRVLAAAGEVPR